MREDILLKKFNVKDKRVVIRKLDESIDRKINYIPESDVKVTILNDIPNIDYLPELVMATWNEDINEFNASLTEEDRKRFIFRTLQGKFIPTALRSIPITIRLENITFHDTTHIYRHTQFSYAASCSGDHIIENEPIVLPEVVKECCMEEYDEAMRLLESCYAKILNHGGSLQDARLMLPRTSTTYLYMTGNLMSAIGFIRQRLDLQVQPSSDCLIAMHLLIELCKKIPYLYYILDVNTPNGFYIKESTTNFASKWYKPLPHNAKPLEGHDIDFVYGNFEDVAGNKKFLEVWNDLVETWKKNKEEYTKENPEILEIVKDCTTGDWR